MIRQSSNTVDSLPALEWPLVLAAVLLLSVGSALAATSSASPGGPSAVGLTQTADSVAAPPAGDVISDRANLLPGYVKTALQELLSDYRSETGSSVTIATIDSLGSAGAEAHVSNNYPEQAVLLLVADTRETFFVGTQVPRDVRVLIAEELEAALQSGQPDAAAVRAVQILLSHTEPTAGFTSTTSADPSESDTENSPVLLWIFMLIFCSIPVLAAPKLFFTRRYTRWSRMLVLSLSFALGGCVGGDGSLSMGFRFWIAYLVGFNVIRFGLVHTRWGNVLKRSIEEGSLQWLGALSTATVVLGSMAAGSASSGSSGGGFSGGGGSFGGGGATGSW